MRRHAATFFGIAILLCSSSAAAQHAQSGSATSKPAIPHADMAPAFAAMDKNKDGVISRQEWRGDARAFARLDADKDGVLSGSEVRKPGQPAPPSVDAGAVPTSGEVYVLDGKGWLETRRTVRAGEFCC